MTIQAIETRYAGCRFRSRLEARWAVFFDALGLRWEYEPETFETWGGGRYLPDFRLPDHNCWVEVKGEMTVEALAKIVDAVDYGGSLPGISEGGRVILLGDVPDLRRYQKHPAHSSFYWHKGCVWGTSIFDKKRGVIHESGPGDCWSATGGPNEWLEDAVREHDLLLPVSHSSWPALKPGQKWAVQACYDRARSARFEWGESG